MIKYALICEHGHRWDAWFDSMSGYDEQAARGLVECPFCGSKAVQKAPMAPAITSSSGVDRGEGPSALPVPTEANSVMPSRGELTPSEPIQALMQSWKAHIEKHYDYVGNRFASEARKMSDGEAEQRLIYGEATLEEAKSLVEDGLPIAPLPMLANPKGPKGVH